MYSDRSFIRHMADKSAGIMGMVFNKRAVSVAAPIAAEEFIIQDVELLLTS